MYGRKLLEFTDVRGYTVSVEDHPGGILHLVVHSPGERHYVRIDLSDAEHLAVALTTPSATPALLVSFLDLDRDGVILTREPSGRFRLTLSGVEDWERYVEFVNPDAERLAAVLAVAAERPYS